MLGGRTKQTHRFVENVGGTVRWHAIAEFDMQDELQDVQETSLYRFVLP